MPSEYFCQVISSRRYGRGWMLSEIIMGWFLVDFKPPALYSGPLRSFSIFSSKLGDGGAGAGTIELLAGITA